MQKYIEMHNELKGMKEKVDTAKKNEEILMR